MLVFFALRYKASPLIETNIRDFETLRSNVVEDLISEDLEEIQLKIAVSRIRVAEKDFRFHKSLTVRKSHQVRRRTRALWRSGMTEEFLRAVGNFSRKHSY